MTTRFEPAQPTQLRTGAPIRSLLFHTRVMDLAALLFVGLLAATLIFWQLGAGSLTDFDEADYAQSAHEMLWHSDFNTPRWNGMEFFDKPPVCQWGTALAFALFGVNEFSARLVSATCGVLVVLMTYVLGRDLFNNRLLAMGAAVGLLGVGSNLFSHGYSFVSLARVGMLDMALILSYMVALRCAWKAQHNPCYLIFLGIPLGLGLMIKSIAGLFAFGSVSLFLLCGLPKKLWWRRETFLGLCLAAAVAAPWHLGQLLIWGRHFWDSYMVSLTVGYVTGEQGHTKDWFFYLRSIRQGFPILYPVIVLGVLYIIDRAWRYKDRAAFFLLSWAIVPFVLYNLSRSKIGWYMIPIYPALVLMAVGVLARILRPELVFALVLLVTTALPFRLPRVGNFNPDVKAVASYARETVAADEIIVNYFPNSYWIRPSALFYLQRPVLLATSPEAIQRLIRAGESVYILADRRDWEPLQNVGQIIYRSGDYLLVQTPGI